METRLAAPISRRIGATSQLAKFKPSSTDDIKTVNAITVNISANATWIPSRRDSSSAYSFTLAWVCCNCATTRGSSNRAT